MPTERLAARGFVPPWTRFEHLARYEWAAEAAKGKEVLDVACGTGYGATILLNGGATRVDGFDLSEVAITEAQRLSGSAQARFGVADVADLPCPDRSYDLFVSFETIEHLKEDQTLLRQAIRVLKPGGTFICTTPNRLVTNPGIQATDKPYNPFHIREYTREELDILLRRYFLSVRYLGQTFWSSRYIRCLNRIGRVWPKLAVRIHQARKSVRSPWEKMHWHTIAPLSEANEPEVLVAVCNQPNPT